MSRIILHVDMDYFYAAIEEREDPSIKDKAVVVCMYSNRGEEGGAVSTCNYIARESGIHSAMPCRLAKSIKPDAVYLPVRKEFYTEVSDRIMEILRSYADGDGELFEKISIDEAFIEITQRSGGDFDVAEQIAKKIKEDVKKLESITCSVGIGPNKIIAKMASSRQKPDGITLIRPEDVEGFLMDMPVSKLWGIGNVTEDKLAEMGIETVKDLAGWDVQELIGAFGKTRGTWLKMAASGVDESPVKEKTASDQIGRMASLTHDTRKSDLVLSLLDELVDDVFGKVQTRSVSFRSVTVTVIYSNFKTVTKSHTLNHPVADKAMLREVSYQIMGELLDNSRLNLRRIGVRVGNLQENKGQKTLAEFF
ncbi:DNA polymerase IV [Methanococcoides sp. NM1]|uniref:DNA polymerase IV n=1 Tax=Methanococcoides sp. NM1 TaxID=1201013 RepID=UPI00108419F2|nr:DNA polymerase IV [Methanococcoides sp. NM1]